MSGLKHHKRSIFAYQLLAHIEDSLGLPDIMWSNEDPSVRCEVAIYDDKPAEGMRIYCSLGLNSAHLTIGDKRVRQELFLAADKCFDAKEVGLSLEMLTDEVRSAGEPFVIGELFELENSIVPESQMQCVLACSPETAPELIPAFPLPRVLFTRFVPI